VQKKRRPVALIIGYDLHLTILTALSSLKSTLRVCPKKKNIGRPPAEKLILQYQKDPKSTKAPGAKHQMKMR
jgi:hypothetical protein